MFMLVQSLFYLLILFSDMLLYFIPATCCLKGAGSLVQPVTVYFHLRLKVTIHLDLVESEWKEICE